jgi:hypothetical protein
MGQEVVFKTEVQAKKMGTEDAVQVRYELQNVQSIDQFVLQGLSDFEIVGGPSRGQNISMVNGDVSMSISVTYAFKPKRAGTLNFPVAVASIGGKKFKSNQASIEVVNGSLVPRQRQRVQDPFLDSDPFAELIRQQQQMAQQRRAWLQQQRAAQQGSRPTQEGNQSDVRPDTKVTRQNLNKNIFIKVSVDKTIAHVGEQITAYYKLYTRIPMEVNLTKLPDLNNFWSQDFELPLYPKPEREILNGVEYQVFTIKKSALFPTQTGTLVLDPAEGEGIARLVKEVKVKRRNPLADIFEDDPFFNQGFGSLLMDDPMFNEGFFNTYQYEDVPVKLKSTPVKIRVDSAIAANKPKSYAGAVGQYKLESKINAAELTTDDVATLTLTIRGSGNFKLLTPPTLNLGNNVEQYDPIEDDSITSKKNDKISGYKTIKYRFTPLASGKLKIPSIEFSYFNPETQTYEISSTPEYTLTVQPGKNPVASGKTKLPSDIHDIAFERTKLFENTNFLLPNTIGYWSAFLVPTFGFLFLIGYQRRREEEMGNAVAFKNKRANKVALKRLENAEKHLKASEQMKFFEETSKAVWLYISDKLNIPLASLSKEMAASLLQQKGVQQDLIDEMFLITDECELALYTPDSGNLKMNQTYSDSLNLIGKLEDKLS